MPFHHASPSSLWSSRLMILSQIIALVASHSHHSHVHNHHRKTQLIRYGAESNQSYEDLRNDFGLSCNQGQHNLSPEEIRADAVWMKILKKGHPLNKGHANDITRAKNGEFSLPDKQSLEVDVYAHVLTRQSNSDVTRQMVRQEIEMVNVDFRDTPFEFIFKDVTYTSHSRWNDIDDSNDDDVDEATAALRVGGGDVLNLFIAEGLCDAGIGGFAQYPYEQGWFPVNEYSHKDRVFLCPRTLLGDSRTVTHEIGHWLGLRHTFEGDSCDDDNEGDFVDDTPQHLNERGTDCDDDGLDTCRNQPGDDPIFNFMSYSRCRFDFTPGQVERMVYQFHEYRRRVFPCGRDEVVADLDVVFDNNPDPFEVAYAYYDVDNDERDWRQLKRSEDDGFENSRFTRRICMPSGELFGFHLTDEDERGFENGGYMQLTVNGATMEYITEFENKWQSTFVVANKCDNNEIPVTLELDPWRINEELSWDIRDEDGQAFVSRSTTRKWTDKAFRKLHHQFCLKGRGQSYKLNLYSESRNGGFFQVKMGEEMVLYSHESGTFDDETTIEIPLLGGDWGNGIIGQAPPSFGSIACVSGSTLVHHEQKGWIPLSTIDIGDSIQVMSSSSSDSNQKNFEPVYAFGHYQPTVVGDTFLELTFDSGTSLQISPDHLFFTEGANSKAYPIPAGELVVGQSIHLDQGKSSRSSSSRVTIRRIQTNISSKGIYAPFTPSGTFLVQKDGLVLSNYISLDRYTTTPLLPQQRRIIPIQYHHTLAHGFTSLHRWFCASAASSSCLNPMYTQNGINLWEVVLLALIQLLVVFVSFGLLLVVAQQQPWKAKTKKQRMVL